MSAVSGQENVSSFPLAGIFFQNMMSDADQGKCTYVVCLYTVAKKVQDIDMYAEVTASGIPQKLHTTHIYIYIYSSFFSGLSLTSLSLT